MIKDIIHNADARTGLSILPDACIDTCVTSPPYYGLRDYGMDAQIGLEKTPEEYINELVSVFREVKRVLKDDGTLWVNIGDSYAGGGRAGNNPEYMLKHKMFGKSGWDKSVMGMAQKVPDGVKAKDLIGIPWLLAFALRADGWYLRQDIIWQKANCMPESVKDRCTKNHEYIFLLSKSPKYYFDNISLQEKAVWDVDGTGTLKRKMRQKEGNKSSPNEANNGIRKTYTDVKTGQAFKSVNGKRNKRSVWQFPTAQFPSAHFATFPEELPKNCIIAGCPEGGIVLDPFMGAGTTALVAKKLDRHFIGFELNPKYIDIANKRLQNELGLFL